MSTKTISGLPEIVDAADGAFFPIDDGITTSKMKLANIRRFPSQATPIIFNYYVDSRAGSDSNGGITPLAPFATIAKLLTVLANNQTYGLAANSLFREKLDVKSLSGVSGYAYGSGERPQILGSNVAANANFAATAGQAGVYQVNVTTDTGTSIMKIWENGTPLIHATSLANCQATAGTFWPTAQGTTTPYVEEGALTLCVHATDGSNIATNGKCYEYTARQYAYVDNAAEAASSNSITGIWCSRQLCADGSMNISGRAFNCLLSDGSKHSMILHQGGYIEACIFVGGNFYWDTQNNNSTSVTNFLVAFDTVGTGGSTSIVNCRFNGYVNATNKCAAIFSHAGSGVRGDWVMWGNTFTDCDFAIGGGPFKKTTILECFGTGLNSGVQPGSDTLIKDSSFDVSGRALDLSNMAGFNIVVMGCRLHTNSASSNLIYSGNGGCLSFMASDTSLSSDNFQWQINCGTGCKVSLSRVHMTPWTANGFNGHFMYVASADLSLIDNCTFNTNANGDAGNITIDGVDYATNSATVAAYQANNATTVYAAGTAYSLTATPAAVSFGTTSPTFTAPSSGTYQLLSRANLKYNAATFAAVRTATMKLRKTSGTAADVANTSCIVSTDIVTTKTATHQVVNLPPVVVSLTAGDVISLFGSLDVVPTAGSEDVVEASIVALRIR